MQLGKEQNLTLTGIHRTDSIDDTEYDVEIRVNFVSSSDNTQLQPQKVLTILKTKFKVSSASWSNLSSEFSSTNEEIILEK